jgi:shikimate kinase
MRNIFLVGMPGAGKSTIGKSLAKRLNMSFVDSDKELIARTGVSIAMIFEIEGEAGFRARESVVLAELAGKANLVVATGGGAILTPQNCSLLRENGTVIYLHAGVDDLWRRTHRDTTRPLLQTDNPRATLQALFEVRDPLYRETAHLTVDTGTQSVTRLTLDILARLAQIPAGVATQ